MIFCLFLEICIISLGISLSCSIFSASFVTVSKLLCDEVLAAFVILSAITLPIKSSVGSPVSWIVFFEAVLKASVADYLTLSTSFWLSLPPNVLFMFLLIFLLVFSAKDKNP